MPTQPPQPSTSDTKTALLDAAERLFATSGIAETSLRAITATAGANLASVHYHFGSKEGLLRAVFARRLSPLNSERLQRLEQCELGGDRRRALRCLLHAFVAPAIRMMLSDDEGDRGFVKLLGSTLFEPSDELRSLVVAEFREVGDRFTKGLATLFPDAPSSEITWRFHFMVGAMAHTVTGRYLVSHRIQSLQLGEEADPERLTARLVDFLETGWLGLALPDPSDSEPDSRRAEGTS